MLMIEAHLEFVKGQMEYHQRRMTRYEESGKTRYQSLHERMLIGFQALREAMDADIKFAATPPPAVDTFELSGLDDLLSNPTQLDRTQLVGLPQELLTQLQISPAEKFQWLVVDLVDRTPQKTISLEVLLIALYRATGEVFERTDLSNRIYRMMKKGVIFSVPGKKGQYTTIPQAGDQLTLEPNGEEEADQAMTNK